MKRVTIGFCLALLVGYVLIVALNLPTLNTGLLKLRGFCHLCDLTYANLEEMDLHGASLRSATLTGANLRGANLSGANLMGATLSTADLAGATLTGANLIRTDLSYSNLIGVVIDNRVTDHDCNL